MSTWDGEGNGHSDIAIGSRLAPGARTVRGPKREFVSRCYNRLVRLTHGARFSDAQCGFKAARTETIRPLLDHVDDDAWFFDTELLLLAEFNGLRVHEVPVDWVEDVDSRVDVVGTALDDNNPDTLLVFLLVAAAYAFTRSVQAPTSRARARWLLLCAFLLGCGFLTKMLQAWIVVPGIALAYFVGTQAPVRRRVLDLLGAGGVLIASSFWPPATRPGTDGPAGRCWRWPR